MKAFLVKLLGYGLALALVVVVAFFGSGYLTRNHRLGATIEKHAKLASLTSPKIILVGGSNLHYGFDSEWLAQEIGLPVVNMGLQGSIGLRYYFNEIAAQVGPGDLVLLLAEPIHYQGNHLGGEETLYKLISKYPAGLRHLDLAQWRRLPTNAGVAIRDNIAYLPQLGYSRVRQRPTVREQTNKYGDYIGHEGLESKFRIAIQDSFPPAIIAPTAPALIRDWKVRIEQSGGRLLLGHSPCASGFVAPNLLEAVDSMLRQDFPDLVLDDPFRYVFPQDHFLDTGYHLLYRHRRMRTRMVLESLKPHLPSLTPPR